MQRSKKKHISFNHIDVMTIPLFDYNNGVRVNVNFPEQWPTVRERVVEKLNALSGYYRVSRRSVTNAHPLIKLIQSIQTPLQLNLTRYVAYVEESCLEVAGSIGYVTGSSKGKPHIGGYYSDDQPEYYLAYQTPIDPESIHQNWRVCKPVRPLIIPQSDVSYMLPMGKHWSDEKGLVVLAIHVPALMVMYRAWSLMNATRPHNEQETVHKFIAGYVLPNMMHDQADLQLINRLFNRMNGYPVGDGSISTPHAAATRDVSSDVDMIINKALAILGKVQKKSFEAILANMPSINKADMGRFLVMPDVMANMQNDWLLTVSRLKHYSLLCDLACPHTKDANMMGLTHFNKQMRLYNTIHEVQDNLAECQLGEVDGFLKNIYRYIDNP